MCLRIGSHLLKKSLIENFIFCAVFDFRYTNLFTANMREQFLVSNFPKTDLAKQLKKRSYEIITENYFCVRHKSRLKHDQHSKLPFFKLNSHFEISNQMSTCWELNLPPINTIYLIISSLEMQRRLIQIKVHYMFFDSVQTETTHKYSKGVAAKNFSPECMFWIQLVSMNVFYSK